MIAINDLNKKQTKKLEIILMAFEILKNHVQFLLDPGFALFKTQMY